MESEMNPSQENPWIQTVSLVMVLLLSSMTGCTESDTDEGSVIQGEDTTDMTSGDDVEPSDGAFDFHGEVDASLSDHTQGDLDTGGDDLGEGDMAPAARLLEGFETGLIHVGGCADTQLYAYNETGDTALGFFTSGPLYRATEEGSVEETLDAASGDFTLKVEIGVDVHVNYCTDALMVLDIWSTYEAISGQAVLSMEAMLGGPDGEADLQLIDVLLVNELGHEVLLESFVMEDVWVYSFWGG